MPGHKMPDFATWTLARLREYRRHLESILLLSAGQNDPERPHLKAEHKAAGEEITRRATQDH